MAEFRNGSRHEHQERVCDLLAALRLRSFSGPKNGLTGGLYRTVKFLDDILRDVGDKMHEVMRKNEVKYSQVENPDAIADTLGISSVMVQDMSGKR